MSYTKKSINLEAEAIFLAQLKSSWYTLNNYLLRGTSSIYSIIIANWLKNSIIEYFCPIKALRGFLSSWDTAPFTIVKTNLSAFISFLRILSETSIICNKVLSFYKWFTEIKSTLFTLKWTYFIILHCVPSLVISNILSEKWFESLLRMSLKE